MGEGKAKNVIEYLDNLIAKGKATNGAISPLKIAFSKILQSIDGGDWLEVDVKSIDIDDYMGRFANLTMGKYSAHSLVVYRSRFNKVISWYLNFLEKPGWTPDINRRNRQTVIKTAENINSKKGIDQVDEPKPAPQSMASIASSSNRVLYPFPLHDGQLVHFSLPTKLYKVDAKRICAFMDSISVEDVNERGGE